MYILFFQTRKNTMATYETAKFMIYKNHNQSRNSACIQSEHCCSKTNKNPTLQVQLAETWDEESEKDDTVQLSYYIFNATCKV